MALMEIGRRLYEAEDLPDDAGAEASLRTAAAEIPGFKPIGIGLPMSIEIRHVYVGKLPGAGIFGRRPDVLLTSAVKSPQAFEATPRALNRIEAKVEDRTAIPFTATSKGSPLVYYSPAMTDHSTRVTLDLVADAFPKDAFDQIADLLGRAAGLPVFAPASLYLLAGSVFIRLVGSLGEKLLDGRAFFSDTLPLDFDTPGVARAQPRKAVLHPPGAAGEFRELRFPDDGYELETPAGTAYDGNTPYLALAIDGRERPAYEGFQASALTGALAERFYHADRPKGGVGDDLFRIAELVNDMRFAEKAAGVKDELARLPKGSEPFDAKKKLLDAYVKNLKTEVFRKHLGAGSGG